MYRRVLRNRSATLGGIFVLVFVGVSLLGPSLAPFDPIRTNPAKALTPPWGSKFWLGTDHLGRDIFSRLLHGARTSLIVGVGAVASGFSIGTVIGLTAGFFGGWYDNLMMRLIDILLSFPGILLALAIVSAIGASLTNVILAVGISSVPSYARVTRGGVLRLKNQEFVQAAEAVGAGPVRIMFRHLLPNCIGPIIVQTSLRYSAAVLLASGLSFLGLGVPPTIPDWGSMLADGRLYLRSATWVAVFPGFAIMLVVLGFNLLGDGLRDVLDPRLRL